MAQKKREIQEVIESLAGVSSYVYIVAVHCPSLSLCTSGLCFCESRPLPIYWFMQRGLCADLWKHKPFQRNKEAAYAERCVELCKLKSAEVDWPQWPDSWQMLSRLANQTPTYCKLTVIIVRIIIRRTLDDTVQIESSCGHGWAVLCEGTHMLVVNNEK